VLPAKEATGLQATLDEHPRLPYTAFGPELNRANTSAFVAEPDDAMAERHMPCKLLDSI
jgi:hypothetical protein